MKIIKNSVIIEVTNTRDGCLEQGGVCGRLDRYDLGDVLSATGMTLEELSESSEDDLCVGFESVNIRDVIEYHCRPVGVVKGHLIQ